MQKIKRKIKISLIILKAQISPLFSHFIRFPLENGVKASDNEAVAVLSPPLFEKYFNEVLKRGGRRGGVREGQQTACPLPHRALQAQSVFLSVMKLDPPVDIAQTEKFARLFILRQNPLDLGQAPGINALSVVGYCNAFLDDENYLSIVLGEENETYTVKDGSYYPILPEFDKLNKGRWFYPTNSQELYTPLFSARAHKETEMGELYDDITAKCMPFNYNRLNNILPILPEAEKYESKLSALAEEKMMKMILDQGELDKFDEFVAQWKAEGGDELTNAYNAWYAEQG